VINENILFRVPNGGVHAGADESDLRFVLALEVVAC